ncbi:hypothetical protein BDZ97DRAFT_322224 [Flammula alnicola]|nr:hypothetical protein BDZ97DRAFT_322224 [Flammula alnicola]
MGASLYVIGPVSYDNEIPSSIQVLVNMEIFLFWWMSWFLLAGGWGDEFRPDWWPTMDGLRARFPARVMSQVVEPIVATGTRCMSSYCLPLSRRFPILTLTSRFAVLRRQVSNTRFVLLDMIAMLTVLSMAMGVILIITALVFILAFSKMDTSFAPFKIPSVIALIAILLFVCWSVAGFYLPILLTGLATHAFMIDRLHYAYLELWDSLVLDTRFLLEEDSSV